MKRIAYTIGLVLLLGLLSDRSAGAQSEPMGVQDLLPSPGILLNSITNLHAENGALWVGPFLNVTLDGGATWKVADADSLQGMRNRVYSIDVEGDVIWVGLGIAEQRVIDGSTKDVDIAHGFLVSRDGGATWDYRPVLAPVDNDPLTTGFLDLPDDTLITYGGVELRTLAITIPELSPPWDIAYDAANDQVWTAGQLNGIRTSADGGRTWSRIVLPPDTTRYLSPELGYDFPFYVQPVNVSIDQFQGLNFQAYSVLVDEAGRVWAGTVGGLNRSLDRGLSWTRYDVSDGFTGNWVISIEEQRRVGRDPAIWAATWPGRIREGTPSRHGVVVTRDGGDSFEAMLSGEKVWDFAFDGPRIYAAGEHGLFVSEDDGQTFRTIRDFHDPTQPDHTFRPGSPVYSVEVAESGLWVGTSDGLFKSTDGGFTWRAFRALVPLSPQGLPKLVPPERVPTVDTYAYPNPFSPSSDRLVRIRYKLEGNAAVTIHIFDFAMNLIRDLTDEQQFGGEREVSWDGTDDRGTRIANGTYFYHVQVESRTFWGKILIVD